MMEWKVHKGNCLTRKFNISYKNFVCDYKSADMKKKIENMDYILSRQTDQLFQPLMKFGAPSRYSTLSS
jgi:hypothetical protein